MAKLCTAPNQPITSSLPRLSATCTSRTPLHPQRRSPAQNTHTAHAQQPDRRQFLLAVAATAMPFVVSRPQLAHAKALNSSKFLQAFQQALSATGSFEERDQAWSRVIQLGPDNAAAWSNRGTLRLQNQQWTAAYEDLQQAAALEVQQQGAASAVVLNNLGNVEGALGRWEAAMQHYQQAAEDDEMGSIAAANFALAAFETQQDQLAIKAARTLLRRDPEFLDIRCALTAFLWASGARAEAEDSWEQLQQSSDGLGAALYSRSSAVERVRHRWPPRATAALVAYLNLSDHGEAEGYDLSLHSYQFGSAAV